jgi:hypothetical protein
MLFSHRNQKEETSCGRISTKDLPYFVKRMNEIYENGSKRQKMIFEKATTRPEL